MTPVPGSTDAAGTAIAVLEHRHEWVAAFATRKGFDSPLRQQPVFCNHCCTEVNTVWAYGHPTKGVRKWSG
jgi:hypothetical protein